MKKVILIISSLILFISSVHILNAQSEDKSLAPYFYVSSQDGAIDQIPLLSTSANVNIAGVIADVVIKQTYHNNGTSPIEAIYVFPSSTRAAVYGMEMKIGERIVIAKVKEKNQAKKEYNKAKFEGKRASLLKQERPNVFQMNVANIMPGDIIEVTLKYTEHIIPEDGIYEFVYPTVVGPRYHNKNSSKVDRDSYIKTPYLKSGEPSSTQFDINISINVGMPIQDVSSPSHQIKTVFNELHEAKISMSAKELNPGNRDVVIQYQLAGKQIQSGLMLYEGEEENFFCLTVQPPKKVKLDQIPPREFIFIIDVSGSMRGFPIDITKKLMRNMITNMRLTDKFNILLFAGSSELLSDSSLAATPENIQKAIKLIDSENGGGSTQLLPAMKRALELPRCDYNVSRSMILVTDGYITVEKEVFDLIRNNLNRANVYAFGVGSGINRFLIEGMAHVGQGEALVILSQDEAAEKAEKFRNYISSPVLTQVLDKYEGLDVYDIEPPTIPDVLSDRPIVIYGKYRGEAKGKIKISGYTGNGYYSNTINVATSRSSVKNKALKYLWARESIKKLGDYERFGTNKNEITRLGLKYNLLTAHTSFIAIEESPNIANQHGNIKSVKQVISLPANVSNAAIGAEMDIEGVSRSNTKKHGYRKDSVKHIKPKNINTNPDTVTTIKRSKKPYKTTGEYKSGDKMYVWAKRGYNLRSNPNTRSSILNLVPFGSPVTVIVKTDVKHLESAISYVDISFSDDETRPYSIIGNWVKVKTENGLIGYIIDSYLLSVEPNNKSNPQGKNLNIKLIEENVLLKNETYDDGAILYTSLEHLYQYRINATIDNASAWNTTEYNLENFTIKEAFVLLSSSWGNMDKYDVLENKKDILMISDRTQYVISFRIINGKLKVLIEYSC